MKKESFGRKLFALVLPMALQNLFSALVSASDALMLGFLDQPSLSAVSLAGQVSFVMSLFHMAFIIGATVLAAQYWGKGDTDAVEQVEGIALRVSMLVSTVFFLLALLVPQGLMRLFTQETELIELGAPYLRIVSWSYLFVGWTQIVLCIMKNTGRTLRSTVYGSTALVLNILLNAVFIFGLLGFPAMGIRGAALATTLSRAVELALTLMENRRKGTVRVRLQPIIQPDRALRRQFWKHTTPVLANELVWGVGFTMTSVIMGHLGSDAVAANAIAQVVKSVVSCVCIGIGTGSGIIVGNALGAGELEQAKAYGSRLCKIAVIAGAISGGVLLCASPLIMGFATNLTDTARGYLQFMLVVCSYYMIGKSVNSTVIAGIFCAGGDTRFGLKCDTITMWCIIVPIGLLAAFVLKWPIPVVYFLLNLDEFVKLPAVWRHYHRYGWVKNLTNETQEAAING